MAEELISNYIDRAAIKADTEFFLSQLKSVLDAYTNLGNTKVNLSFSDSIRSTTTNINQLNESLKQTTTVSQQASKAIEVNASAFRTESASIEENVKLLVQNKAALDKVQDAQKLYKKQLDDGKISLDQYTNKMAEAIKRELEFKQSIADINEELKHSSKADFAAPNSIDQANANIAILKKERNATDVNDVERIAELNGLIDKNNQLIDENNDKLGKQKINIGNYPTAFSGAFKFLNDELATIEGKLAGPGLNGKEIENLALKQEALRNATALVGKEFSSTTAQQNAFKEAATQIGVVFGKDSETFKQFNSQVQAGKAELDSVKGAMSGAEAAGSKFGKVLGGIWGGIRQIAYAIPGVGIAGLVGLLLTPLGALGAELFKYVKTSGEAGKATEDLNEKLKSQAEIIDETKSKFSSAAANVAELKEQVLLAKQGFLDKDQVVKQYNETMGKTVGTVKNLEQVEQELVQNGDAYIQFTLLKAAAQVAYGKAAEKAFEVEVTARKKADEFRNVVTDVNVVAYGSTSFNAQEYDRQQAEIKKAQERRRKEEVDKEKDKEKKLLDIANDFEKQAAGISKKFHFNFFGDGKEDTKLKEFIQKFFDSELKAQQEAYTKISQSDTVYLDTRLQARKRAYEFEYQIIEGQKNYELEVEKNKLDSVINSEKASKNEKINARKEYANRAAEINERVAFQEKQAGQRLSVDLGVIRRKQVDDDIALIKKEQEEIAAVDKADLDNAIKQVQNNQKNQAKEQAEGQQIEINNLNKWYDQKASAATIGSRKRERIEEEYAKRRADIEYGYSIAAIKDQIDEAEKIIAIRKAAGINVTEDETKLSELRKKLSDAETKHVIENNDRLAKSHKEKLQDLEKGISTIKSLYDETANFIDGLISASTDAQKNAIQGQIDDIDRKKQKEIDAVNQSLASQQDKANRIAILEANAQAKKEQLEKRQKQLDIQRARTDKALNIGKIITETALAVVHQLSSGDPYTATIRAIAAGAIGAAQLAVAVAAPIPQYKTGTNNHPGGLMWAGDGGKSEIVIPPGGNAFTTPSVATLYDMPRGTVVLPDANQAIEQSFNMMYKPVLPAKAGGDDMQVKMLSKKMDAVINAINNIPGTKVINTWSGVEVSYQNVSRLWEYINRNTQS